MPDCHSATVDTCDLAVGRILVDHEVVYYSLENRSLDDRVADSSALLVGREGPQSVRFRFGAHSVHTQRVRCLHTRYPGHQKKADRAHSVVGEELEEDSILAVGVFDLIVVCWSRTFVDLG